MNRILKIAVAAAFAGALFTPAQAVAENDEIKVMSFNVRTDTPRDGENRWDMRKDRAANAVKFYDVDVLGTQEVRHNQFVDFNNRLDGYTSVGVGREDGKQGGEYCAVWFKSSRFELLDSGNFWLSETPEIAGSRGWDTSLERIATWVKLRDRHSGKSFFFLNTHLDHRGVVARRESARMLLQKAEDIAAGLPVIMTGDFNAKPTDDPVLILTDSSNPLALTDSRSVAKLVYGPEWTFHDFGRKPLENRNRIDYVFVRGGIDVNRYGSLAETEGAEFVSDHNPLLVGISLK